MAADVAALTKAAEEQTSAIAEARKQLAGLEEKHAALSKAQPPADPKALEESEKAITAERAKLADIEKKLTGTSSDLTTAKEKASQVQPAAQAARAKADELKARYQSMRAAK